MSSGGFVPSNTTGSSGATIIATSGDLPATAAPGTQYVTEDTGVLYVWSSDASAFVEQSAGTGSGTTTIGTYNSQASNANGGVISGTNLYFQSATATNPGMMSTGAQTFAGAKQFNSTISVGGALDASSAFSITSTSKGFLLPKMTWAQKKAISSPTIGLAVYDTDSSARSYKSQGGEYVSGVSQTTFSPWFDDSCLMVTTPLYGIAPVADVSGSLNNKYFLLYCNSGTTFYVWFNVNGAGTDPAVPGATGIQVTLATNATALTVGNAILSHVTGANFQDFDPLGATTVSNSVHGPGFIVFSDNLYGSSAPPPVDGPVGHATGFTFYHSWTVFNNDWVINSNGDVMIVCGNGVPTAKFGSNGGLTIYGIDGASLSPGNNSPGITSQIADILWYSDGGGNIGANGANRPGSMFLKNNLTVGGTGLFGGVLTLPGGSASTPSLQFTGTTAQTGFWGQSSGGVVCTVGGANYWGVGSSLFEINVKMVWNTDGAADIGSASPGADAGRPNNVYIKSGLSVGTSGAIAASALVQFGSTTQGVLLPSMTTTQKNAISAPAEGLMVYDNVLHAPCWYNGTVWKTVTGS